VNPLAAIAPLLVVAAVLHSSTRGLGGPPPGPQPGATTPPIQQPDDSPRFVPVGPIQVAYREWGQGDPLILITGLAATMALWDPTLLAHLATHYRVIVFDNRGVGATTTEPGPVTIARLADDAAGFMAALGIDRAHVLGYSLGGFVAQELALQHPDHVQRLVLLNTSCGGSESVPVPPGIIHALTDPSGTVDQILNRVIAALVPDTWARQHRARLEAILLGARPPSQAGVQAQVRAIDTWGGTCARLSQVAPPTLVVTGTRDEVLVPANSLQLVRGIPNAWLAQFREGGHGLQYQYPEALATTIRAFLEAP
jgi:pimeloyl-ACP methyl ester carboxylesterase